MGELLSSIRATTTVGAKKCPAGKLLASLSVADCDDLEEALRDFSLPTIAIVRALQARGLGANENNWGDHRKGRCRCE